MCELFYGQYRAEGTNEGMYKHLIFTVFRHLMYLKFEKQHILCLCVSVCVQHCTKLRENHCLTPYTTEGGMGHLLNMALFFFNNKHSESIV